MSTETYGFVGEGRVISHNTGYDLPGVCLTVTILRD